MIEYFNTSILFNQLLVSLWVKWRRIFSPPLLTREGGE